MSSERPKLSICISTFNRASFIGATLDSIIKQATNDCEIVVLDAASTDGTERIVRELARSCEGLRYIRQDENNGIDRDFDSAVSLARGEYCWLMSDDDLLKHGAVSAVLDATRRDPSLIVVNAEAKNIEMDEVLAARFLDVTDDCTYRPGETDRLFVKVGPILQYIGCVVIKRAIWLERDRESYYGSLFIHVGVIFQRDLPGDALVIAKPLITYRYGNARSFSSRYFEIAMFKWPAVVWSVATSDEAKRAICKAEPWKGLHFLLFLRAVGLYSVSEYRLWIRPRLRSFREGVIPCLIAIAPGVLVNAGYVLYYSVTRHLYRGILLKEMQKSRFYVRNLWLSERGQ